VTWGFAGTLAKIGVGVGTAAAGFGAAGFGAAALGGGAFAAGLAITLGRGAGLAGLVGGFFFVFPLAPAIASLF
jgi:hypothetical protein